MEKARANVRRASGAMLSSDEGEHGICSFPRGDCVHATEIQRTFRKKARAAFDLMAKNRALRRAGTRQTRLCGSKDCHKRNSKAVCEVHGSCVICKEHTKSSNLLDQFLQRCLAGEILGFPVETL